MTEVAVMDPEIVTARCCGIVGALRYLKTHKNNPSNRGWNKIVTRAVTEGLNVANSEALIQFEQAFGDTWNSVADLNELEALQQLAEAT